jgi:hypothetical protein
MEQVTRFQTSKWLTSQAVPLSTVSETLASNDSDTALVTAGAIIDYVDAQDANIASDTLTFTNKTFDANGTGNSITNIEVADFASGVVDTDISDSICLR